MLLLALQTTPSAADDGPIDTLTLILVVIFIAAMLALSLLMRRENSDPPDQPPLEREHSDTFERPSDVAALPPRRERPSATREGSVPVWLQGVALPSPNASLADATRVIEALLTARRDHDLAGGLRLYTPSSRDALAVRLGFDSVDTAAQATFDGDPPSLRSAEILEGTGSRMVARATYSDRTSEIYTLVRLGDAWLIEEIDSSR